MTVYGLMLTPSVAQESTITTSQKHLTHGTHRRTSKVQQWQLSKSWVWRGGAGRHVSLARKRVVICRVTKLDLNMAHPQAFRYAVAASEMSAHVLLMKLSCRPDTYINWLFWL